MDLDIIVNARVKASVRGFVAEIEAFGFVLDGMSPELLAPRYRRGAAAIDVLAPEGLGERTDLTTPPVTRFKSPAAHKRCSALNESSTPTKDVPAPFHGLRCSDRSSYDLSAEFAEGRTWADVHFDGRHVAALKRRLKADDGRD
jgi:hypothetical protein